MKNVLGFIKANGIALAIVFCSVAATEMRGMNPVIKTDEIHGIRYEDVVTQKILSPQTLTLVYDNNGLTGRSLWKAAEASAPHRYFVTNVIFAGRNVPRTDDYIMDARDVGSTNFAGLGVYVKNAADYQD